MTDFLIEVTVTFDVEATDLTAAQRIAQVYLEEINHIDCSWRGITFGDWSENL